MRTKGTEDREKGAEGEGWRLGKPPERRRRVGEVEEG